ncbi:hypothetical protein, partial [uncultured Marinobacter sp.]|uniref:hypothetical protein n=1 Tax=uncultured Marinobacter sp. TaxID=187379 RepID=UPI002595AB6D
MTLRERKKNKVLRATLVTFKREAARANSNGKECIQTLMNMGRFYLLAEIDELLSNLVYEHQAASLPD